MKPHFQYLRYVLLHKWYVFVECCKVGIIWQGLVHDLSKFSPTEWFPYVDQFYGSKKSPDFDQAWLHHQHHNPHHWQHWILNEDDGGALVLEMPIRYRKEMVCDWKGAGLAMGKPDIAGWYKTNKDKILMGPETRKYVEIQLLF